MPDVIDLFAGAGGFSLGARMAGLRVRYAVNHWAIAVQAHQANHPEVEHALEDATRVNWHTVPKGDILIASPACQGHSKARGVERPHHDAQRATAWCVVAAVEAQRPQAFVVENVSEFLGWALFGAWAGALKALGYHLTTQVLDAADFGLAQRRPRAFIVGHRRAPLHLASPGLPHQPAASIIQWEHPAARPLVGRKKPFAPRTQACIDDGLARFGDRFLVPYYKSETKARDAAKPIGTLTTQAHFGVVSAGSFRMLSVSEMKAFMGFPDGYRLHGTQAEDIKLLGNAVCPPKAAAVLTQVAQSLA